MDAIQQKIAKTLEANGATSISIECEGIECYLNSEYTCILTENLDGTEGIQEILREEVKYSCCGDILDQDHMLCPSCLEHC